MVLPTIKNNHNDDHLKGVLKLLSTIWQMAPFWSRREDTLGISNVQLLLFLTVLLKYTNWPILVEYISFFSTLLSFTKIVFPLSISNSEISALFPEKKRAEISFSARGGGRILTKAQKWYERTKQAHPRTSLFMMFKYNDVNVKEILC